MANLVLLGLREIENNIRIEHKNKTEHKATMEQKGIEQHRIEYICKKRGRDQKE